jgi:NAD(P)-dependent dehydrogenase (short-subunit alcohol dehydrogenase family)
VEGDLPPARNDEGSAATAKLKNASFLEIDITADASVARVAEGVPALDVLVNNAVIIADGAQELRRWLVARFRQMH